VQAVADPELSTKRPAVQLVHWEVVAEVQVMVEVQLVTEVQGEQTLAGPELSNQYPVLGQAVHCEVVPETQVRPERQ